MFILVPQSLFASFKRESFVLFIAMGISLTMFFIVSVFFCFFSVVKLHLKGCTASSLRCLSASKSDDVDYLRIQFECFRVSGFTM